jgi:hypothetical protein
MSLVDVDRPVTFTVSPPRSTADVAMYEYAQRNVASLAPAQRHALAWALSMYHDPAPVERARAAPVPARRKVGVLEAIRGVKCCDPTVVRQWAVWRRWIAVAIIIVGVVLMLETWQRAALIGVACVISLGLRFSMTRGKASVCH